jgi:S-adenosylmethionine:tRNA ribosyltransferase-isomerase
MFVSEFDYDLPEKLIAQEPSAQRDRSRLLVVERASGTLIDSVFDQLPGFLAAGDMVVLNNTRVFPARLIGRRLRTTVRGELIAGGRVEIFLIRQIEPLVWEALVRPGKSMLKGARVEFARGKLTAEVIEWRELGRRLVRFEAAGGFDEIIDRIGRTPLPPYIKRDDEDRLDAERYQTVYARERGAVAAPTAGLHFTPELFDRLRALGVEIVEITLHVGYGTFQPVRVERVEDHQIEPESYTISEAAADRLNGALKKRRRIIAVGTTTTRALESAYNQGAISPGTRATNLFIYPGFEFRVVGGLVTNFHLPRSSLLMLVAALAGRDLILDAYQHAVDREYRFYSYGDAMLIL